MKITAHTGCNNTPDNSIESIHAAIDSRADIMEIDLRMQKGEVVLTHDVLEEEKAYVTLRKCLEIVKDHNIIINCDLKEEQAFLPTYNIFSEHNLQNRLMFSGSYPISEINNHSDYKVVLNSEVLLIGLDEYAFLTYENAEKLVELYNKYSSSSVLKGLNLYHGCLHDKTVTMMHKNKINLSLWTVDTEEEMEKVMSWDVYNMTTNFPSLARELLGRK